MTYLVFSFFLYKMDLSIHSCNPSFLNIYNAQELSKCWGQSNETRLRGKLIELILYWE